MSPPTIHDRQRRIVQLSQEWGIVLQPAPHPLSRPPQAASFRTPPDDQIAEDLLQRRAAEVSQQRPKSGLTRAFSSNNLKKGKNWDSAHVLEVLTSWVASSGSPGVAEALIAKLAAAGIDISGMQKQKGKILNRRRSAETSVDRTKLLRLAVEGGQTDMVRVLLPHADPLAIDSCLPPAIRTGSAPMVESLLRYGATLGQSDDGLAAFRQACVIQGHEPIVSLILQSDGRPPSSWTSQSLIDATQSGCLGTVLQLSRSNADGNHNQAEALKRAIHQGRRDIAVAIVMGNSPPQNPGINEAFQLLFGHSSLNPQTRLDITELLLCAGAEGAVLSEALERSCDMQFFDMISLLMMYGTSIEYNEAAALKKAISRSQMDLVEPLLNDATSLHPSLASSCVPLIPKQAAPEVRYLLLGRLLEKGASGRALDESLIDAAQAGDISSIELLLSPIFSRRRRNMSRESAGSGAVDRHAVASVDHKGGEALRTAVLRTDTLMVEKILGGKPSQETLSAVFPLTRKLSPDVRYDMMELFLKRSLSGECLHAALQEAINDDKSQRDESLIQLLLKHDADVNFNQGSGLAGLIKQHDLPLLAILLQRASPQTAAARIPDAAQVTDRQARHDIMSLLFNAGGSIGTNDVATALSYMLDETPVDMSLLQLLLHRGSADVNLLAGVIVKKAVNSPDPKVLEIIFSQSKPSAATVTIAFNELVALSSTEAKAWKLKTILARSSRQEDLDRVLAQETLSLSSAGSERASLSTLKHLLGSGADPNAHNATALVHVVRGCKAQIADLLFACSKPPSPASLASTLRHALRISDHMDRFILTKKLVEAGAHPAEINRALVHLIKRHPEDLSLLGVLASKTDASDGEALMLSVSKESPELVELLLAKTKHSTASRGEALATAMVVADRIVRNSICKALLGRGVSPEAASNALLVAARDGDMELGDVLMAHGANISSNNGQAIIEACRGGSVEVLKILLKSDSDPDKRVLERGFQSTTEVSDLNKRAMVFEQLLERGVRGDLVDAQLQSAARSGESGEGVLRVLLAGGADPNYDNGEAVFAATRSAFIRSLELLLGIWSDGGRQKKPSQPTLVRALRACWALNRDTRFHIIGSLIKAGLQPTEDLHTSLNEAVNEDAPEERLVKLLLGHGASPLTNECKTLIDAAQKLASSCLALLLQKQIPQTDISRAFSKAFTEEGFASWFSAPGLATARMLLEKGAKGDDITEALVLVMKNSSADNDAELANQFVTMLVANGPDVNFRGGQPLQLAASKANVTWARQLLSLHPSSETLSLAFQCIFDTALGQDEVLQLFRIFTEYRREDVCVDVMSLQQGSEPVLVRAIKQYPRSVAVLSTLLDAGYYYDQMTTCKILPNAEDEESSTLLTWALAQPQKRVSSAVIKLLIERGANVNSESSLTGTTPLMLATQTRRLDIVKTLVAKRADLDVCDCFGRSPLSMATTLSGDNNETMTTILRADPPKDDGSLHNAASDLNLQAVKALVEAAHDPDFPSPLHQGRSALAEICLHGSDGSLMTADRERTMQKIMACLVESGSDLTFKENGKSLMHLCFDATDPVATSRALLRSGMWKHVNKSFNLHVEDEHTYSLTMYMAKVRAPSDMTETMIGVLKSNRAQDVFYANEGPQPPGAVGLPHDLEVRERARKGRLNRMAEEAEDFALDQTRKQQMDELDQRLMAQRAANQKTTRQALHNDEMDALRARAHLENSLAQDAYRQRRHEQHDMRDMQMAHMREMATVERDAAALKHREEIEWQNRLNAERAGSERALAAIRMEEKEATDKIDRAIEQRMKARLEAQRKLAETNDRLARRIGEGVGDGRRQIGYVTELN